jgi:hypothetical protein
VRAVTGILRCQAVLLQFLGLKFDVRAQFSF